MIAMYNLIHNGEDGWNWRDYLDTPKSREKMLILLKTWVELCDTGRSGIGDGWDHYACKHFAPKRVLAYLDKVDVNDDKVWSVRGSNTLFNYLWDDYEESMDLLTKAIQDGDSMSYSDNKLYLQAYDDIADLLYRVSR